jgi:hypothetical protein
VSKPRTYLQFERRAQDVVEDGGLTGRKQSNSIGGQLSGIRKQNEKMISLFEKIMEQQT